MKATKETNCKKTTKKLNVGAHDCAQKGITLIALIITIIVMLILVAVTVTMAVNGGLFENAGKAVGETQNAIDKEQQLANGRIKVGSVWYDSIDDYLNNVISANQGTGDGETGESEPVSVYFDTVEVAQITVSQAVNHFETTITANITPESVTDIEWTVLNADQVEIVALSDDKRTATVRYISNNCMVGDVAPITVTASGVSASCYIRIIQTQGGSGDSGGGGGRWQ